MRRNSSPRRCLAFTLALALVLGCATAQKGPLQPGQGGFLAPSGFNQYTPEQEVQLGRQAAAEADAQLPELPPRGPIQDYVSTLGQKLARNLPENPYQFDFKVVNQKEINAFALPGGPIRINLGTIQAADSEAQLAGVLAHEISHVYLRHATRNASREAIISLPAQIAGAILGNGVGGQLARLGIQFGAGSIFLKYSRQAESEADRNGAKLMYETGYDPRAMAQFFEKLEGETGNGGPQFLSDHPNPGNRAAAVSEAVRQLPAKRYMEDTPDFQRIKQLALQMHPYTAQQIAQMQRQRRQQFAPSAFSNVQPSGSMQFLNGNGFGMQYPSNWKAYGDRSSAILMAPPDGVSQNGIAYGVVISGYAPQQPQSLEESTQQVFTALEHSNPGMREVSARNNISVNGLPANVVNLISESPLTDNGQPVNERDVLVTLQRPDGRVLWMLFIAPEPHFNSLEPTFQEMIQSLRIG